MIGSGFAWPWTALRATATGGGVALAAGYAGLAFAHFPVQAFAAAAFANAGMGIGGAVGGLVAAYGLTGYIVLFLVNALTYLAYVAVLVAVGWGVFSFLLPPYAKNEIGIPRCCGCCNCGRRLGAYAGAEAA